MFSLVLIKKLERIDVICFIWLVIIYLNSFQDIMPIRILFNLRFGHLFIIGISFYKIKSGESNWWNHLLILLSYLVSFAITDSIPKHIILLGFIAVFYLFVNDKLKWIKLKPLIILGEISYALYLIHQFIGYFIIYELIKLGIKNNILLILIPTTVTLILSYIITYYIEKPIQLFLRNTWNKYHIYK